MTAPDTLDDPTPLVVLLGASGCGKSSFINALVGTEVTPVGQGLDPVTKAVAQYTAACLPGESEMQIIDTPGFSDCHGQEGPKSDLEILQATADFLHDNEMSHRLTGILFIHSTNSANIDWRRQRRNIVLLRQLAGSGGLGHVVVVTTSAHNSTTLGSDGWLLQELRTGGAKFICSDYLEDGAHSGCESVLTPQEIIARVISLRRDGLEKDSEEPLLLATSQDHPRRDGLSETPLPKGDEQDLCDGQEALDQFFQSSSPYPPVAADPTHSTTRTEASSIVAMFKDSSHVDISGGFFAVAGNDVNNYQTEQQTFHYHSMPLPPFSQLRQPSTGLTANFVYMAVGVAIGLTIPTIFLARIRGRAGQ